MQSSAHLRSGVRGRPSKVQVRSHVTRINNSVGCSNPTRSNVKEGYEAGMGRVLLSTRSYNPGDIVLTDMPLVHYTDDLGLAKKYARMSEEERPSIMDLKHLCKPEDAENAECREDLQGMWIYAQKLAASETELSSCSHAEIFQLMTCSLFNMHSFSVSAGKAELEFAVLFPLLSQAAHSCSPNCMIMKSKGAFMATKPISPGDILTISYIERKESETSHHSTIARRTALRSTVLSIVDLVPEPNTPLVGPLPDAHFLDSSFFSLHDEYQIWPIR
jgi:hypothetical protein